MIKSLLISLFVFLLLPLSSMAQGSLEVRYVASSSMIIYAKPNRDSNILGKLKHLDRILVLGTEIELTPEIEKQIRREKGIWLRIVFPQKGFIFQRRLIQAKSQKATAIEEEVEATPDVLDQLIDTTKTSREGEGSSMGTERIRNSLISNLWIGMGVGLLVFPEESGYSSSIGSTLDFYADFDYPAISWLKIRAGLNMTSSTEGTFETSTNSVYTAIRYPFEIEKLFAPPSWMQGIQFQALGGLAWMQSSLQSGGSGSASSIGYLIGTAFSSQLFDDWRWGAQFLLFSGSASFGSTNKFVGSNQVQVNLEKAF